MTRRFTNIDIDHFFRSLDRLEPIYDENKVHQIINSHEAMARLKGKPFKPLKFILMTTLFAVLIAAMFLWPAKEVSQPESLKNANQVQLLKNEQEVNNIHSESENENTNFTLAKTEKPKESTTEIQEAKPLQKKNTKAAQSNEVAVEIMQSQPTEAIKTDAVEERKPLTPPETMKGNLKMVVADQELLEKLGFQFIGESVYYKNKWGETKKEQAVYKYEVNQHSRVLVRLHRFNSNDSIQWTSLDFYPKAESYRSGEIKSRLPASGNLVMENDTLFPIYCPQGLVNEDPNDIIFWFHITDDFIQLLPTGKQHFAEKLNALKPIKRKYPELNLVNYSQEPLVDSSTFVNLTKQELFDFGFTLDVDSTLFQTDEGYVKNNLLCYSMIKDSSTFEIKYTVSGSATYFSKSNNEFINHPILSFITTKDGDFETKFDDKDLTETRNLVPILVRKDLFENVVDKDRVYWFELSDKLFKALPTEIGTALQKEYNYIVAENKEELEKPECKYFDECKNTLLIGNFKVFPNPANQRTTVTFTLPKKIDGRISLVDLAGRERQVLLPETTLSKGHQRFDFDLSDVSEGMYLITLYSDQGVQMQRLIVSH